MNLKTYNTETFLLDYTDCIGMKNPIVMFFLFSPQIILAFGNYMNSAKRGPAYGFKLQSLDMVSEAKSCHWHGIEVVKYYQHHTGV